MHYKATTRPSMYPGGYCTYGMIHSVHCSYCILLIKLFHIHIHYDLTNTDSKFQRFANKVEIEKDKPFYFEVFEWRSWDSGFKFPIDIYGDLSFGVATFLKIYTLFNWSKQIYSLKELALNISPHLNFIPFSDNLGHFTPFICVSSLSFFFLWLTDQLSIFRKPVLNITFIPNTCTSSFGTLPQPCSLTKCKNSYRKERT